VSRFDFQFSADAPIQSVRRSIPDNLRFPQCRCIAALYFGERLPMNHFISRALATLLAGAAMAVSFSAAALAPAKGKVILTITGKVADKNSPQAAEFDLAMLEKLPQQSFTTMTPWDKKPIKFTGPLLRDVLAAAKASGTTIKATALNDYQTSIPLEDSQKFDVMLAHKMNGELIPVKTKGPLFIVYPFDAKAELRATTYYERSAWQLKSMAIE
jgi:hypothetical protein